MANIYLICPVRNCPPHIKTILDNYVASLENEGHLVYYPHRDTEQDADEMAIVKDQRNAVELSDEVHVYWYKNSDGSYFDFGMAFAHNKPIFLVNREEVKPTKGSSYTNLLLELG